MASHVQVGNFKPEVEVDVVLLASLVCSVIFAAGAGDDEELVVETADRVSVAGILEFIHGDAVECIGTVVDNLIALFQRGRGLVNLATSN